jgi:hypothetical protein
MPRNQRLHRQELTQGTRIDNQVVALENELKSAQKCIHTQDGELKSLRNEMREMMEDVGSFLGRWNTSVGLLTVSEGTSSSQDVNEKK